MATIAELFDLAVRYHQNGDLPQAEPLYRQILQADPSHAEALHLLGILANQTGHHQAAVSLITQAIAVNPGAAGFHFNLGTVHHALGQSSEALNCYRQAVALDPYHAGAYHNLGNILKDQGQLDEAIACYRQAIGINPNQADTHYTLGLALVERGAFAEAGLCFREALRINPNHADALNDLGNVLKNQGELAEAITCYRQALGVHPNHADAHHNLGLALENQGDLVEAGQCYRLALRNNPNHASAHNNLGRLLKKQGHLAEAIECYRQALRINPHHVEALNNLGNALKDQGQLDEAAECYRQALRLDPQFADAHNNLGSALKDRGQLAEAVKCYEEALRHNPNLADAHSNLGVSFMDLGLYSEALEHYEHALRVHPGNETALWNRSLLRLLTGDFEGGWQDYEYRWTQPGFVLRHMDHPRWDGSPLEGRTILLHAEQGLGDTIHFLRYAPLVKERGGIVLLECPPSLQPLLTGIAGVDRFVPAGTPPPPFDVHSPLLSLPGIFGTTPATVPAAIPYLRADSHLIDHWRQQLEPLHGFRIAIAWQGSTTHGGDRWRSVPLARFETLARVAGVRLLSVQKGAGADQIAALAGRFDVVDLSERLDNEAAFMDTAAVLNHVDLVVTVDSAIAHVAGALGAPVWVVLALTPDWRWLLEREDSPWYPTMRLFRQQRFGDWSEVFERVAAEVRRHIEAAHGPSDPNISLRKSSGTGA